MANIDLERERQGLITALKLSLLLKDEDKLELQEDISYIKKNEDLLTKISKICTPEIDNPYCGDFISTLSLAQPGVSFAGGAGGDDEQTLKEHESEIVKSIINKYKEVKDFDLFKTICHNFDMKDTDVLKYFPHDDLTGDGYLDLLSIYEGIDTMLLGLPIILTGDDE